MRCSVSRAVATEVRSVWLIVEEIDGHDHIEIQQVLSVDRSSSKRPLCVIAHTTKGKGVSFMENDLKWHYSPPSKEQLELAIAEVNRA